jgi:Na+/proline symporter
VFAWQNVPVRIVDDALKLVSIGIFVSTGLGLNMKTAMLSSGVIILAYTLLGGLWAVAVTDVVQFIILGAAVLIILPMTIEKAGGLTNVFENAPEGFFHLTQPEQGYGWVYIGSNVFLFCLAFSSVNWSLIQRYYCVPREKDAVKVGGLVFVLSVIGPPLILLPVIAARQFLTGVEESGQVYPILCAHVLPAGILGLVVAAMFSATMSMMSSDYNVCAGVLTNDVYRRYVRPGASAKELVVVGRLMTLVMGVSTMAVAFMMLGSGGEDLFRNMVKLFSIAVVPVAIPMMAGLLSRRTTTRSIWFGFSAGFAAGLLVFFLCPDSFVLFDANWKKENAIVWITTAVTTTAMVLTNWLQRPDAVEQKRIDGFLNRLEVPIGQHDLDDPVTSGTNGADVFSYRVVGTSIWVVAVILLAISPWVGGGLALKLSLGLAGVLIVVGGLLVRASRSA